MAADAKAEKRDTPATDAPAAAKTRWAQADDGVRTTAKWLITTITAFTGIVFASGGFIVKGNLVESYFWQRAAAMCLGAAAAALGLAAIIGSMASTLARKEPSLKDLPAGLKKEIEDNPRDFLPEDANTILEFQDKFTQYHVAEREAAAKAKQRRAASDKAASELEAAEKMSPPPDDIVGLRKAAVDAEERAARSETSATIAAGNMTIYREAYVVIIDRAKYQTSHGSFSRSRGWLICGGLAVVLGATTYTIAISYTPPEVKPATAAAPTLGTLTQRDNQGGRALWAAAGFKACETAPGSLPVLVLSGDGTTTAPWQVQTLPTEACEVVKVSVIGEVGTVVIPEESVTIVYETTTTEPGATSTTKAN